MASPKRVAITFAAAAWVAIMSADSVLAAGTEQAHVTHGPWAVRPPKVVLISLDGAKPDLIQHYLRSGALSWQSGLGRLVRNGVVAGQNITATPSLTAVSHIAIATGSTAAHNDIPANTYHAIAQPIGQTLSGFGGPIGGYQFSPLGIDPTPTAEPLWVRLRNAGKKVVTATWPGGDGRRRADQQRHRPAGKPDPRRELHRAFRRLWRPRRDRLYADFRRLLARRGRFGAALGGR